MAAEETWPDGVLLDLVRAIVLIWIIERRLAFHQPPFYEGPQVSRWIKHGLPVRPDGRINVWEASRWLDKFYDDHKRRTGRDLKAEQTERVLDRLRVCFAALPQ